MKNTILLLCFAAFLMSCGKESKPQPASEELKLTVRMKTEDGRSADWTEGDIVYLSDDASTRPGFQFKASKENISSDGKSLQATYRQADPEAKIIYAIHAPEGRIRMKKTEQINVIYDGTLAGAAIPAGSAAKGTEITLSPTVGVGEFTLKRGYVAKLRISSSKAVFPNKLTYDFGGEGLHILKTTDIIELPVSGPGPFYIPLVPGTDAVSFDVDYFDGADQLVASGSYTGTIDATAGRVSVLGELDSDAEDVVDPSLEEFEKARVALKNMCIGLNLSGSFEVLWKESAAQADRNNPSFYEKQNGYGITTQSTMNSFFAAGFRSVRIPVTWWMHMDDVYTSTIDKVWLDRIEEVVNYCKNANLYCIINIHHDAHAHEAQGGQWIFADVKNYEKISSGLQNVWKQIATRFKDYGEFLLFEGYNEITDAAGTWTYPKNADDMKAANDLNQVFVNTVRKTGGNNATRNLIVSTYSCSSNERTLKAFEMPSDVRPDHLIVQVHNYSPSSFCSFGNANHDVFGTEQDYADIQSAMNVMKRYIVDKGWPCILGEYGAPMQRQASTQQPDGSWRIKRSEDEVAKHAYYYTLEALKTGLTPMFWYIPQEGPHRTSGQWTYPKVKDALIRAWNEYNNENSYE